MYHTLKTNLETEAKKNWQGIGFQLVTPDQKDIKVELQWTKDMLRTGRDPVTEVVNNFDVAALMRRYKTHFNLIRSKKTELIKYTGL